VAATVGEALRSVGGLDVPVIGFGAAERLDKGPSGQWNATRPAGGGLVRGSFLTRTFRSKVGALKDVIGSNGCWLESSMYVV
jgi:hypothetical protein